MDVELRTATFCCHGQCVGLEGHTDATAAHWVDTWSSTCLIKWEADRRLGEIVAPLANIHRL